MLKALAAPLTSKPPTAGIHRLRRGLPGYLILFAPHAFAPQRQNRTSKPPSPLVFLRISTNFTSTLAVPLTSSGLEPYSIEGNSVVEPQAFTPDLNGRLRALRPVIPNNASPLRITAAAGTKLAGASSAGTVIIVSPPKELYNPRAFITHAAWLDQACAHCPIFPTAASRRSLGRVSVPVWLIILSDQLLIVALVSRYLTN